MGKLFLAAFILIVLLILFLIWVIIKSVEKLNEKVKSDFLRNLNEYDEHIEKKSKELKQLREELELAKAKPVKEESFGVNNGVEYVIISDDSTNYRNAEFASQYSMIKNVFADLAQTEMNMLVEKLLEAPEDSSLRECRELREALTTDIQYEIMTLPEAGEKEILNVIERCSPGSGRVVRRYTDTHSKLTIEGLVEYLDEYLYKNDLTIKIYSSTGERCFRDGSVSDSSRIEYIKDERIIEGYVVGFRDRIYDFSI